MFPPYTKLNDNLSFLGSIITVIIMALMFLFNGMEIHNSILFDITIWVVTPITYFSTLFFIGKNSKVFWHLVVATITGVGLLFSFFLVTPLGIPFLIVFFALAFYVHFKVITKR